MARVTVARFFDARSAELARIALEGSGLRVSLAPEGHASLIVPAALGGIRLQVAESDADAARDILEALVQEVGGELF